METWKELLHLQSSGHPDPSMLSDLQRFYLSRDGHVTFDYETLRGDEHEIDLMAIPLDGALDVEMQYTDLDHFVTNVIGARDLARHLFAVDPDELGYRDCILVVECQSWIDDNHTGQTHEFQARILGVLDLDADLPLKDGGTHGAHHQAREEEDPFVNRRQD